MTWLTGVILYILIWWTVLFTVLPWGVKHEFNADPAKQAPGAPVQPHLKRKFLITTLLAGLVWGCVFYLIDLRIIDFREQSIIMMQEDKVK